MTRIHNIRRGNPGTDRRMVEIREQYPKVFTGLGRATGVPDIHIELDETVTPVQQDRYQSI